LTLAHQVVGCFKFTSTCTYPSRTGKIMRLTFPKSQGKQVYYDARKSAWGDIFPHPSKTRRSRGIDHQSKVPRPRKGVTIIGNVAPRWTTERPNTATKSSKKTSKVGRRMRGNNGGENVAIHTIWISCLSLPKFHPPYCFVQLSSGFAHPQYLITHLDYLDSLITCIK
jgi:hypothetical protein